MQNMHKKYIFMNRCFVLSKVELTQQAGYNNIECKWFANIITYFRSV